MTLRYAVGIKIGNRSDQMTVEAEDALIAALKVKAAHPEAAITYVRKRNARGDRRHPHSSQINENPVGQATGDAAPSRLPGETVHSTTEDTMPDPVSKPPGRALLKPIIIKNPFQPAERPEINRSPDQEEEPELRCHPTSSSKCLRLLDLGSGQASTAERPDQSPMLQRLERSLRAS